MNAFLPKKTRVLTLKQSACVAFFCHSLISTDSWNRACKHDRWKKVYSLINCLRMAAVALKAEIIYCFSLVSQENRMHTRCWKRSVPLWSLIPLSVIHKIKISIQSLSKLNCPLQFPTFVYESIIERVLGNFRLGHKTHFIPPVMSEKMEGSAVYHLGAQWEDGNCDNSIKSPGDHTVASWPTPKPQQNDGVIWDGVRKLKSI